LAEVLSYSARLPPHSLFFAHLYNGSGRQRTRRMAVRLGQLHRSTARMRIRAHGHVHS